MTKLPKNKAKAPILQILYDRCGVLGTYKASVYRVTEKVISVVSNDRLTSDYRRSDGYSRSDRPTGLAAVCRGHLTCLKRLEDWLRENGKPAKVKVTDWKWVEDESGKKELKKVTEVLDTFVYDSGWRPAVNSRYEVVRDVPAFDGSKSHKKWFEDQGFELIDLSKD